ncbi:MAG: phosphoribosyl transferase [Paludibacter sp. 47-17]|nr:MAG: phosphoribosyl transferase [Paludibacter sp. 47-17]
MYYRNIADLNRTILANIDHIPADTDLIVGIPRSGMVPAVLIAQALHLPYTDMHSFLAGRMHTSGNQEIAITPDRYRNIIMVDDSVASGNAITKAQALLHEAGKRYNIRYCTIYIVPTKLKLVDIYFEVLALPQIFQWNMFHHSVLEKSCFDIDGVLCEDPSLEQDDDGPLYLDFLNNAPPLYIPGCKIGTIVTSRHEKYRSHTEAWLNKHNVRYHQLVMYNPGPDPQKAYDSPAALKASVYKSMHYFLFIESSLYQAQKINQLTGKPVLCTENFQMITDSESILHNIRSGKYFPGVREFLLTIRRSLKGS